MSNNIIWKGHLHLRVAFSTFTYFKKIVFQSYTFVILNYRSQSNIFNKTENKLHNKPVRPPNIRFSRAFTASKFGRCEGQSIQHDFMRAQ